MRYYTNHTVFPAISTITAPPPHLMSEMQTPTPPPSLTPTSKRKRPFADSARGISPSPSRLKTTNLPSRPIGGLDSEIVSEASPRTSVAGHLQSLNIHAQDSEISKLDFGMGIRSTHSTGRFAPEVFLPSDRPNNDTEPVTPPPSSHSTLLNPSPFSMRPNNTENMDNPTVLEIPESPSLNASARTSPPAIPTPDPRLGNKSPVHITNAPASSSQSLFAPSLWWTDTEITGHNPSDPTDDGYGINGVGFIPTPAMATARAEKRRRQVREWKEREAREARARRGQRRLRNKTGIAEVGSATVAPAVGDNEGERDLEKKVRFSEKMETEI